MNSFRRFTVIVLSSLLAALPAMPQPQTGNQPAGQINAMIPAATRNSQPAKVKEDLNWNDLLKTEHSGRVRAGLKDGSILSLGSDSELRIVQHDSASQQTSLEMDFGKLRSQVVKITKPGGKFEVKTPNAVIGVIGTDFYAAIRIEHHHGDLLQGQSFGNAAERSARRQQFRPIRRDFELHHCQRRANGGRLLRRLPPSGFRASDTPPATLQASLTDTDIPSERRGPAPEPHAALGFHWHGSGGGIGSRPWRRPNARRGHATARPHREQSAVSRSCEHASSLKLGPIAPKTNGPGSDYPLRFL